MQPFGEHNPPFSQNGALSYLKRLELFALLPSYQLRRITPINELTRPKSGNAAHGKICDRAPYAGRETAARQLVQLAAGIEPVQDGRIHIEKINAPFPSRRATAPSSAQASSALFNKAGSSCAKAALCAPACACAEQESPELGRSASAGDGGTLQTSIAMSISSSKNFVHCLMPIIHPE